MKRQPIFGPDINRLLKYSELPIGATITGFDPNLIRTGTWRFIKPVLQARVPPCNDACAAGVDVRGFIRLIKERLLDEAFKLYVNENPFPAVCGRVCTHPCETACNRGSYDEPVSINGLENFIGERAFLTPFSLKENGKAVAVIGSGPSGLSCSYFLRRLGYSVKIFERAPKFGGILRYGIPEYRLPKKILDKEIQKLIAMGVEFEAKKNIDQKILFDELDHCETIFISTGAHILTKPKIPGVEEDGVYLGLDFLRRAATGEIRTFKKKVAIIGGGNTAVDVARTILRIGGKPAIYYRRTREEMPAMKSEILDCEEEGIKINFLASPVRILFGKKGVTGIEFTTNRLGERDENNRPKPVPVEGANFQVAVDAVVMAVGEKTDLSPFLNLVKTEDRLIITNPWGQTTQKRIFAGGDVAHYERTVVHAIGSGKRAAIGIDSYLKKIDPKEILDRMHAISLGKQGGLSFDRYLKNDFSMDEITGSAIQLEDMNPNYFSHRKRRKEGKLSLEMRTGSFREIRKRFTSNEAEKEADRCLSCGNCNACENCFLFCPDTSIYFEKEELKSQVNYEFCKGCGICAEECPTGSMMMIKEE